MTRSKVLLRSLAIFIASTAITAVLARVATVETHRYATQLSLSPSVVRMVPHAGLAVVLLVAVASLVPVLGEIWFFVRHSQKRPRKVSASKGERIYVVRPGDTMCSIAAEVLGAPRRWIEIAELNVGKAQPDGTVFTGTWGLHPGWRLALPEVSAFAPTPAQPTLAPHRLPVGSLGAWTGPRTAPPAPEPVPTPTDDGAREDSVFEDDHGTDVADPVAPVVAEPVLADSPEPEEPWVEEEPYAPSAAEIAELAGFGESSPEPMAPEEVMDVLAPELGASPYDEVAAAPGVADLETPPPIEASVVTPEAPSDTEPWPVLQAEPVQIEDTGPATGEQPEAALSPEPLAPPLVDGTPTAEPAAQWEESPTEEVEPEPLKPDELGAEGRPGPESEIATEPDLWDAMVAQTSALLDTTDDDAAPAPAAQEVEPEPLGLYELEAEQGALLPALEPEPEPAAEVEAEPEPAPEPESAVEIEPEPTLPGETYAEPADEQLARPAEPEVDVEAAPEPDGETGAEPNLWDAMLAQASELLGTPDEVTTAETPDDHDAQAAWEADTTPPEAPVDEHISDQQLTTPDDTDEELVRLVLERCYSPAAERLALALRAAGDVLAAQGRTPLAATLGDNEIKLVFATAVTADAPAPEPWASFPGMSTWVLTHDATWILESAAETALLPSPCPALVPVGFDGEDLVLLNAAAFGRLAFAWSAGSSYAAAIRSMADPTRWAPWNDTARIDDATPDTATVGLRLGADDSQEPEVAIELATDDTAALYVAGDGHVPALGDLVVSPWPHTHRPMPHPKPLVRVLGPISVEGPRADAPAHNRAAELVAYLALQPGMKASKSATDNAVFSHKRMARATSWRLHKAAEELLGIATDGKPCLREEGRHFVLVDVESDLDLFHAQREIAPEKALQLVTGPPLATAEGDWALGYQVDIAQEVADVGHNLAYACLDENDDAGARFAARAALCASPYDDRLWSDLLEAAAFSGAGAIEEQWAEVVASLGEGRETNLPPALLTLHTRLLAAAAAAASS